MDKKRLVIALVIAAVAVVLLIVSQQTSETPPATTQPTSQAATRPVEVPAPTTAAAEEPAAKTPPEETPPEKTPPGPKTDDGTAAAQETPPDESKPDEGASTQPSGPVWLGMPYKTADDKPLAKRDDIVIGSTTGTGDEKFLVAVQLATRGASVKTVELADHFVTVEDRQLFNDSDTPEQYLAEVAKAPGTYRGFYRLINPVYFKSEKVTAPAGGRQVIEMTSPQLAMATRWVYVYMTPPGLGKTVKGPVPVETELGEDGILRQPVNWLADRHWRLSKHTADTAEFQYELAWSKHEWWPEARKSDLVLRLTKTYTVRPNDYTVYMTLKAENLATWPIKIAFDQGGPHGIPRESLDADADARAVVYLHWTSEEDDDGESPKLGLARKSVKNEVGDDDTRAKYYKKLGRPHLIADTERDSQWVGNINQYFGAMLYAVADADHPWQAMFYAARALEARDKHVFMTGAITRATELPAGSEAREFKFELYAGPKQRDIFTDPDHPYANKADKDRYVQAQYIQTLDFRDCFCAFHWLTLALMWLLQFLSKLTLGNYGVALIILVALVRLVLHPLTRKSQTSMMRMQKLAPQMQKLKEKYADDKDTLQKETMKFYKEQGASPILGCLPMFLQMPIWIALWTTLQASVELRHAAFLPVWITDLAAPDRLFTWTTPIPLIGTTEFNLLPILVAVSMFLQTKFSPQASGPAATDQQQQQQKMMKWMMPLFMLWIFYGRPSGLNLYIMTSTFAGVAESWVIRRHIKAKEELAAAQETTVDAPGRGSRGKRAKKIKKAFWTKNG